MAETQSGGDQSKSINFRIQSFQKLANELNQLSKSSFALRLHADFLDVFQALQNGTISNEQFADIRMASANQGHRPKDPRRPIKSNIGKYRLYQRLREQLSESKNS